jgi:hypothetical protein
MATDSAGVERISRRRALKFLTSVNPCEYRVGWLSVANLTKDNILEGEMPSLAVPTAVLFG